LNQVPLSVSLIALLPSSTWRPNYFFPSLARNAAAIEYRRSTSALGTFPRFGLKYPHTFAACFLHPFVAIVLNGKAMPLEQRNSSCCRILNKRGQK
jgi:hypothetical protein